MPEPVPTTPEGGPRILLCGWAGAGNIGDELLTGAAVDVLRRAGARVVVSSRDPAATIAQHLGVEAIPWGPRGVRSMGRVDGVCLGPGGILQDTSSAWSLPGHLAQPLRARAAGAVVAAVGVGAEPLRRRWSGVLLRRVLRDATVVTRDDASTDALTAVGLHPRTSIDLAFSLTLPVTPRLDEIVVAVGPSTRPGRFAPAARRLDPAPNSAIARAVDSVAARLGCRVVLTRFRGERDHDAAVAISTLLSADHEILGPDVDEHVRRIAGARLVVSSRYHPVVLAALAGTPALVVSAQPKVVALANQIGVPGVVRVESWDAAAAHDPGPVSDRSWAPPGLGVAHDALRDLVRVAGETRGLHRTG